MALVPIQTEWIVDLNESAFLPGCSKADNFSVLRESIRSGGSAVIIDLGVRDALIESPIPWLMHRARVDDFFALDLLDEDRWPSSLISFENGHESRDLGALARLIEVWSGSISQSKSAPVWELWAGAVSVAVSVTEVIARLYADQDELQRETIDATNDLLKGKDGVNAWRRFMREMGMGQRAIVEDPWFQRLALGGPTSHFSKVPIVLVPLFSPSCSLSVARKVTRCVFDRAVSVRGNLEGKVELFLIDGEELYGEIPDLLKWLTSVSRGAESRRMVLRTIRTMGEAAKTPPRAGQARENRCFSERIVAEAVIQLSRLKFGRDSEFVRREVDAAAPGWRGLSTRDWQRGLFYQYPMGKAPKGRRRNWRQSNPHTDSLLPSWQGIPTLGGCDLTISLPEEL